MDETSRTIHLHIEINRRQLVAALALLLLGIGVRGLESETLTLSTSYPAPSGVYQSVITTGGAPSSPVNTVLVRDAGDVTLGPVGAPVMRLSGTGSITANGNSTIGGSESVTGNVTVGGNLGVGTGSPTQRLDVNGSIQTESSRMFINGFDGANMFWFRTPNAEPNSAFLGFVKQSNGDAGAVNINTNRVFLQGFDGANNFWFRTDGAEPNSVFLGFNGYAGGSSNAVLIYRDTFVRGVVRSWTTGLPSFLVAVEYNDDTGTSYGCPAGYFGAGDWHVSCGGSICGHNWDWSVGINNGWLVMCVASQ